MSLFATEEVDSEEKQNWQVGTLTVRDLEPEDEIAVAEIERLAIADLRKVYRPTPVALTRQCPISRARTFGYLVALVEGRVVGSVYYRIVADGLSFLSLGVHPDARRCGVATALVRHLEMIGRSAGCRVITVYTVRETGNVEIFQRMGFIVESEEPATLFESEKFSTLSEVLMRKELIPHQHQR